MLSLLDPLSPTHIIAIWLPALHTSSRRVTEYLFSTYYILREHLRILPYIFFSMECTAYTGGIQSVPGLRLLHVEFQIDIEFEVVCTDDQSTSRICHVYDGSTLPQIQMNGWSKNFIGKLSTNVFHLARIVELFACSTQSSEFIYPINCNPDSSNNYITTEFTVIQCLNAPHVNVWSTFLGNFQIKRLRRV